MSTCHLIASGDSLQILTSEFPLQSGSRKKPKYRNIDQVTQEAPRMVVTPKDEDVEEVAKQLLQDAARAKQALIQPSPSPSGEILAFFGLYGVLSCGAMPFSKATSQMPHRVYTYPNFFV